MANWWDDPLYAAPYKRIPPGAPASLELPGLPAPYEPIAGPAARPGNPIPEAGYPSSGELKRFVSSLPDLGKPVDAALPKPQAPQSAGAWQTLKDIGGGVVEAARGLPGVIASTFEGVANPYAEQDWKDRWIEDNQRRQRANVQALRDSGEYDRPMGLGIPMTRGEWAETTQSFPFTLATLGPAIAGSVIGRAAGTALGGAAGSLAGGVGAAPGAVAGGHAGSVLGGMAGSYLTAGGAAANQFIRDALDQYRQDYREKTGKAATPAEVDDYFEKAVKPQAWRVYHGEAAPESLGTVAELGLMKSAVGEMLHGGGSFPARALKAAAKVGLSAFAVEPGTEAITQQIQQPAHAAVGLTDEAPRSLTSLEDWRKSVGETYKQAAATSLFFNALGIPGGAIAGRVRQRGQQGRAADQAVSESGQQRDDLLNAETADLDRVLGAFDEIERQGNIPKAARERMAGARANIAEELQRRMERQAPTPTGEPGLPGSFDPSLGLPDAPPAIDPQGQAALDLSALGDWQRAGIRRELGRIDEEAVRRAETARLARAAQEPRTVPFGSSPAVAGLADIRPPALDRPVLEGEWLPPETMPRPVRRAALADEVASLNRAPVPRAGRGGLPQPAGVGPERAAAEPLGLPAPALDWADLAALDDLGIGAPSPSPPAPGERVGPARGQLLERSPPIGRPAEQPTVGADDRARLADMLGPRPSLPSPPLSPRGQEPLAPRPDEGRTAHPAIRGGRLAFPAETGTLGIPNAEMPQIAATDRGALVNFLKARGIGHATAEISPALLRPSQAEFDPEKVAQAQEAKGGDRSILASSDGRVLDGHHQWLASLQRGEPVKVMRLDAPLPQLLDEVRQFPSATRNETDRPFTPSPEQRATGPQPQSEITDDRQRPQNRQNALQTQAESQGQAEPQGQGQGEIQALLDRGGASLAPAPADAGAASAETSPERRYTIRPTGYPDGSWHVVGQNGVIWRFGTPEGTLAKRFKTERAAMAAAEKLNAQPTASSEPAPEQSAIAAKPLPAAARWNRAAPAEREALLKSAAAPSMAEARAKWSDIPEGAAKRRLRAAIKRTAPTESALSPGIVPAGLPQAGPTQAQPTTTERETSISQPLAPDTERFWPATADGLPHATTKKEARFSRPLKGTQPDIAHLVRAAREHPGQNKKWIEYAPVSTRTAQRIQSLIGLDVSGYAHQLDEAGVRHILNEHANATSELLRGQAPIREEDFARLSEVVNDWDSIALGKSVSRDGKPSILYRKQFADGETFFVEEVRTGRRKLAAKSLWKLKSTAGQRATPDEGGVAQTSETFGGRSEFSIPQAADRSRSNARSLAPAQARAQLVDALGERHIEALERAGRLVLHEADPTGTGAAGFVDPGGRMHLVAPNLEGDALSVALHEAMHVAKDERFAEGDRARIKLAHAGLRLFGLKNFIGGPSFTDLVQQVRRLAAQGDRTAMEAIDKARREDPDNADEESVAYLAQYADINKPLVQRVLAAIRAALYRMGLKVHLTADDVRALALSALKSQARAAAQKTRTARARDGQPAYSRLDAPLRQARNFSEARETAKTFLGQPLTSQDGLIASLSRNNIDKMLSASAARKSVSFQEHALAVANLDRLFSRSVEGWAKTDRRQNPNVKAIHRLFAPMVVGDKARLVKITVKAFSIPAQGNRIYSVEALEVTDGSPVPEMVDADRADGSRLLTGPTGHVETLIQRIRNFNSGTDYSQPTQEADATEQARLWEEFQQIRSQFKEREARASAFERWFGKGTEGITARDGKPLVLYHGTPAEFYRFDSSRSGANSRHPTSGLGFFMTADRGAAARYGANVLELHAKIDKPYYLTDADLMAVDSVEAAIKFKRRLQEKGHDGAVVTGPGMAPYAIAFESRQVKLASNQNPTDSPDFRFSRSAMKSVEANIRRGLDALTKALLDKTSVRRAMYRPGLGWVDFVWGSEGRVTPSGKTRGAMGIAHILEARQRKDGMSRAEAEKLAYDLVEVIARGREIRRYTFANTANVTLELGRREAVLTKTQGSNAWVLSGWEVKPGATGVGNGTPRATLNASTPTQGDQGAGFTEKAPAGLHESQRPEPTDLLNLNAEANDSIPPSGPDPNRYSRPGRPGPAQPAPPAETKAQAFQRAVQDKFVRFQVVQEWLKKSGIDLTPQADVYGAEALAPKKTAAETETAREKILKPLIARAAKNGWALGGGDLVAAIEAGAPLPATFKPSIGEYLHAHHAKERNAAIAKINPQYRDGGSGLTDAQADAILARYRGVRGFSLFERLAADFRGIADLTRARLLASGILSQEMADAWQKAYRHYVPLKGGPEGAARQPGTGPGISVAGRQRRALGHGPRDERIIENLWRDHERAIALSHKQTVAKALRQLLAEAANPEIGTVGQPEKRAVLAQGWAHQVWIDGASLGAFPSYSEARAAIAQDSLDTGRALSKYAVRHQMADQSVVYMGRPTLADNEVALYEDGQLVRLQLNDELLARAARNLGADAANGLLKMGQSFNRWLSSAYTGYNPEFILTNVARDLTAGTINLTGKYGIKTAGRALAAYPGAVRALWRHIRTGHDPLVERYRAAGGSTGAAYLSDLERIGSDIKRVFQDLQGARETWAGGDRAGAVRVAIADKIRLVGRRIENMNKIGENALRVAAFKTLLDAGKSEAEAARAAGEVTVNFNRKGELTAQLGGLYLFFNPSVQGTKIMWDALFRGPHRAQAQALAGGLALLAFGIAQSARGGSDDDEKRWRRIPGHTKDRNLVIPIGQDLLTIPVPYGYGAFWSLGNILSDLMSGEDGTSAGIRLASTVFEQFSPIGNPFAGDEARAENLLTFLPTAIKPAMSVAMNRTELGRPLMPEVKAWNPGLPDSRRMWRSTQGTMWERAAEAMNRWSGGDRYRGGLVDVSPETLKLIWTTFAGGAGQFATDAANLPIMVYQGAGETIKPREIPILRRFFKTATLQDARAVFNAQAGAIQEALATFNAARRDRNFEAARDIQSEQRELLALGRTLRSAQQAVRARRQMEDEIGRSDLSLAEKRRQLEALERKEEAIYSKFHDLFMAAKRREAA